MSNVLFNYYYLRHASCPKLTFPYSQLVVKYARRSTVLSLPLHSAFPGEGTSYLCHQPKVRRSFDAETSTKEVPCRDVRGTYGRDQKIVPGNDKIDHLKNGSR